MKNEINKNELEDINKIINKRNTKNELYKYKLDKFEVKI